MIGAHVRRFGRHRRGVLGFALSATVTAAAVAQDPAPVPRSTLTGWGHRVEFHAPDLDLAFWLGTNEDLRNNPRSVTVAYSAIHDESLVLSAHFGVADPPRRLRELAGRYRGFDVGVGIAGERVLSDRYRASFGVRLAYAWCPFDFEGYVLSPSGRFYTDRQEGRGALRQISVEPQWVHRFRLWGSPLSLSATVGLEVGGRGMFSALELYPGVLDGFDAGLRAPNEYHPFMSARARVGVAWDLR